MHIGILNEFFYPDTLGGTPQKLSELSIKLRTRHDDQITVVTSTNSYRNLNVKYSPYEEWGGIKIHRVDGPHWSEKRIPQRLMGNIVFTRRATHCMLDKVDCDVVLVSSAPPILPMAAMTYMHRKGVPYVYYVADLDPDRAVAIGAAQAGSLPVRILAEHQRKWFAGAQAVVALGRCMKEVIVSRYGVPPEKVAVIEVGTDAEAIRPMPRQSQFRQRHGIEGFVVMYTGNFGKYHDFDTILDAAKYVWVEDPSVTFVLVGRGAKKEHVENRIATERIRNVKVFDFVPEEEYADLLASADICLITLEGGMEGLCVPGKFYSILAAGRPTLAVMPTNCEVVYAINDEDVGSVVELGDPVALACAISHAVSEPDRLVDQGARARALFESRYTSDHIADRFREVLLASTKGNVSQLPTFARS